MPLPRSTDTIAAPITAPGRAAVAVVRVSGSLVPAVIRRFLRRADAVLGSPRSAVPGELVLRHEDATPLDYALATYFPAPKSFTGEDVLELSLHGSPLILELLLAALSETGVRPAQPGEFTQRAFMNGKMDLAQAEAVADVIAAEGALQLRVAGEQLSGRFSTALLELGEPLRDLLAEIEAYIDFPDDDISPATHNQWRATIAAITERVSALLDSYQTGRRIREGALVVLCGVPNAGKSSLLNRLLGEERAIVTPYAGTTRDTIEEAASFAGLLVRLCDTAGIRPTEAEEQIHPVEKLGIDRSWERVGRADLAIFVLDPEGDLSRQGQLFSRVQRAAAHCLVVLNKIDVAGETACAAAVSLFREHGGPPGAAVSARTGEGIELLRTLVGDTLLPVSQVGSVVLANSRHRGALQEAFGCLARARAGAAGGLPPELVAIEIRAALRALDEIVGVTHTEDILGRIFSKFCIGK